MAQIKETRKLDMDDLRHLCIHKQWYTRGNNDEYSKMLNMCEVENMTANRLYKIASDIKAHSNTENEISSIMFEIARICVTFFDIN